MAEVVRELSGASFIRAKILFMRAPLLWSEHLPKTLTSEYHHTGIEFNIWISQGHKPAAYSIHSS